MNDEEQIPELGPGAAIHIAEMLRKPNIFPSMHMRCPVLATSDADDHCYIGIDAGIQPASDNRKVLRNAAAVTVMDLRKGAQTSTYHLTAEQCTMLATQLQIVAQQLWGNESNFPLFADEDVAALGQGLRS